MLIHPQAARAYPLIDWTKLKSSSTQCDSWRLLHPQGCDYTFYSYPPDIDSRIDYIMIQHLIDSSIGHILHFDHAPSNCDLHLPNVPERSFTWRLNESLLPDSLRLTELQKTVKGFLESYSSDQSSTPIKWEVFKCVLCCVLRKRGSRLKKKKEKKRSRPNSRLFSLNCTPLSPPISLPTRTQA